jgi:DNA modification methylase
MTRPSWIHLTRQDPRYQLPDDLRSADPFGGTDVGWLEQMTPFVREFSQPNQVVADPFAGLGTTLLAAVLEQRIAWGLEIHPARVSLAQRRLAVHIHDKQTARIWCGNAQSLPWPDSSVHLILTNVPYFKTDTASLLRSSGNLYHAGSYQEYLSQMERVWQECERVLLAQGTMVCMVQNLRTVSGELIPLAWDLARSLAQRFQLREERILVYERPTMTVLGENSTLTNRAHEYALIARLR